jgi:Amt family ammonium transporter
VGAVVGLVIATPSCGYTAMGGAFLCGVIGGVLCNIACSYVRTTPDLDDQLDVFPAHGTSV